MISELYRTVKLSIRLQAAGIFMWNSNSIDFCNANCDSLSNIVSIQSEEIENVINKTKFTAAYGRLA